MKINKKLLVLSLITSLAIAKASAQTITAKHVSAAEAKKNTAANNEFLRALQTGDVSKLGDVAAVGFQNHGVGEQVGPDSLKSSIRSFYSHFKPAKVDVISRTNDGHYFADWVRYTGQNPTAVVEGIEMTSYENGKAIEHWFFVRAQPRKQ